MKKFIFIIFILFAFGCSTNLRAQENELICSQRHDFCFQIPPNFFMLTTNDIESNYVSYKSIDAASSIEINNGTISKHNDLHSIYLAYLGLWTENKYRITIKKEYEGFFIFSGYTTQGRGFYQKVIKIENDYASAYLEFPKGNKKYSNVSQMIFDYFEQTVVN